MATKIITYGTKNRRKCDFCGATVSYEKEDIKQQIGYNVQIDSNSLYRYIICPQCKSDILLEATKYEL